MTSFGTGHGFDEYFPHTDDFTAAKVFTHVLTGLSVQSQQRAEGIQSRIIIGDLTIVFGRVFERDVTAVQHGRDDGEELDLQFFGETQKVQRLERFFELGRVVDVFNESAVALSHVKELGLIS